MRPLIFTLILVIASAAVARAQANPSQYKISLDIAHGQKFWNDPSDMVKEAGDDSARVQHLTNQMKETASPLDASLHYLRSDISREALAGSDLLFIHIPSALYSEDEVAAIRQYVQQGGSLFLVLDSDYWSTLKQTNVNDIIEPFGIQFGKDSPDTLSGAYTKPSAVTSKELSVVYHGGRTVEGGTPFCFTKQSGEGFGVYRDIEGGGKIVVMGDGMVSLYMTHWEGSDYPSQQFMHEVFRWLLQ